MKLCIRYLLVMKFFFIILTDMTDYNCPLMILDIISLCNSHPALARHPEKCFVQSEDGLYPRTCLVQLSLGLIGVTTNSVLTILY